MVVVRVLLALLLAAPAAASYESLSSTPCRTLSRNRVWAEKVQHHPVAGVEPDISETASRINGYGYDERRRALHFPYGEEATDPFQDKEALKFTGHERDFNNPEGTGDDLDYMHARYFSPLTARFISVDPVNSGNPKAPQTWNRYSYALNRPLILFDPNGECAAPAGLGEGQTGICIEAFIAAPRIMGLGFGDNRSFVANDRSATARISLRMIVQPSSGEIVSQELTAATSHAGLTKESSIGLPGSVDLKGAAISGEEGTDFRIALTGKNGFTFMEHLGLPGLGEITVLADFSVDKEGVVTVDPSSRTKGFPSIEGYSYRIINGNLVIKPLFTVEEQDPLLLNDVPKFSLVE